MKKFFIFSLIAVFITACSKYDDGDLWDKVNDLDTRVETLEKAAKTTNSDIESLRSLLTALQKNVYVSKVKQKEDQSGYIIEFTDNTSVTISNGVDGIDAPSVSVRKDEDGIFYWTIGGEWLLVDDQLNRRSSIRRTATLRRLLQNSILLVRPKQYRTIPHIPL